MLPSANAGVFASPDETAVAVSVAQIRETGSASLTQPQAIAFPWMHPRSYEAVGTEIKPVGFLGWAWWLALANRVSSLQLVVWIASLIAASGCLPWYWLLKQRYGSMAAWWGTALAWTFPTVLLYTNRALFGHVPQLSLVLWSFWVWSTALTQRSRSKRGGCLFVAGVLLGIGISFRPVEAMWIAPLFVASAAYWMKLREQRGRWFTREHACEVVGVGVGLVPLALIQWATYGAWYRIGYWLTVNPDPAQLLAGAHVALQQTSQVSRWVHAVFPYGIHVRPIAWNVRWFFGAFLWPWMTCVVVFAFSEGYRLRTQLKSLGSRIRSVQTSHWLVGAIVWACGWILVMYGSGLYADQARVGAITLGNSFLRYTLPMGFLFAWSMTMAIAASAQRSRRYQRFLLCVCAALVMTGVGFALGHDEEGMLTTRQELQRYAAIRTAALQTFPPQTLMVSDRSDKVFFPAFINSVSPMPTQDQLTAWTLATHATPIGLFARPLSFTDRDVWRRMGYDVQEIQTFGRERLYRLSPFVQ